MMHRPWHVWPLLVLLLSLAVGGLGWLTNLAHQLDKAERRARHQAELEERIGLALWRMDASLMPILVREAAWPDDAYESNYPWVIYRTTKDGTVQAARTERRLSPLVTAPPEFVLLHFQVRPNGEVSSPQVPPPAEREWTTQQNVAPALIETAEQRLRSLTPSLSFASLLELLPQAERPPEVGAVTGAVAATSNASGAAQMPLVETFAQQQLARPNGNNDVYGNDNDFSNRNTILQNFAQQQGVNPRNGSIANRSITIEPTEPTESLAVEAPTRALWVAGQLLLARRVDLRGTTVVQGCWLDWDRLTTRLRYEVADLVPHLEFVPARVGETGRLLATLPVRIEVPEEPMAPQGWTPIRIALVLAWVGLLVGAAAAGVGLQSVMALSERRAAFVAAVTHELRTPLTTFQMYAEMLAGGMVAADRQPVYLETLRVEADRLSHLVENVLLYARLERGRNRLPRERWNVPELVSRLAPRLEARAAQAGLTLDVVMRPPADIAVVRTDAGGIEQILFNLVDNACKYASNGSERWLRWEVSADDNRVVFRLQDHGPGIPQDVRRRLFKPFSKTAQEAAVSAPGVGLGLALCKRMASDLGGTLELERSDAAGTMFVLRLPRKFDLGENQS